MQTPSRHLPARAIVEEETDHMNPLTAVANPYAALEPLADTLLVNPIAAPTMTTGGIHLPDSSQETFNRGVVEKTGPKVETVKVGDLVLFGKYAGTWLTLAGKDRLAMKEVEVFLRIPTGGYAATEHGGKLAHLAGEPCDECQPKAELSDAAVATTEDDSDARSRLRAMRDALPKGL
jgi:chaperonin GroES